MKNNMKNNQYGRSMVEMLGVLAIIGVLSVGGFSMVRKMQDSYDTNKVMDEISTLARKARTLARESSLADLKDSLPDGVSGESNPYTGTAGVQYKFESPTDHSYLFSMEISQLPEEICMQIATSDWGSKATTGFKGIKVGSQESEKSMSLSNAATACEGNNNTINMYYR